MLEELRFILPGLVGGAAASAAYRWANANRRRASRAEDGWYELRPSWLLIGFMGLCLALCALPFAAIAQIRPSVGEAWPFLLLFCVFAAWSFWVAWFIFGRRIAWKGREIVLQRWFFADRHFSLDDVVQVEDKPKSQEFWVRFRDGYKLRLSKYHNGASELSNRAISAAEINTTPSLRA